ncbi:hypothetical protein C7B80_22455 [Cyanosarcina cf. burmensis CCALA 770]|nr:hypothetical protein C7B80_22455 [Cyanosarcina cf. burmensis CCALA 770]
MKKSKLLILSLLALSGLISNEKALAANYFPVCRIEDGQAIGYITVSNGAVTISGKVGFIIYDSDNQMIDRKVINHTFKFVSAFADSEREIVASVPVEEYASKCKFIIPRKSVS